VKQLYLVRNDRDVAHYSDMTHDMTEFLGHFSKALTVLQELLEAHIAMQRTRGHGSPSALDATASGADADGGTE
jgi:hypothetical protein